MGINAEYIVGFIRKLVNLLSLNFHALISIDQEAIAIAAIYDIMKTLSVYVWILLLMHIVTWEGTTLTLYLELYWHILLTLA